MRTYSYFQALIDERRAGAHRDDVMGQVIEAEVDGRRLTDTEILDACFLLLIAGLDTITNSLTLFYHQFANRPDLRAEIAADPDDGAVGRRGAAALGDADAERLPRGRRRRRPVRGARCTPATTW